MAAYPFVVMETEEAVGKLGGRIVVRCSFMLSTASAPELERYRPHRNLGLVRFTGEI